jgi:hypothetical protein
MKKYKICALKMMKGHGHGLEVYFIKVPVLSKLMYRFSLHLNRGFVWGFLVEIDRLVLKVIWTIQKTYKGQNSYDKCIYLTKDLYPEYKKDYSL